MHYYSYVVLASWAVFIGYWLLLSPRAKRNAAHNTRALVARGIAGLVAALLIFAQSATGYHSSYGAYADILGAIGSALTVLGIAYAVWARTTLGRNWGMPMSVKEAPELVTGGPYARVRHPIYTGVLLAIFGSMLTTGPVWLIIFVCFCAYFLYSARQEERLLARTFPDAYPAYKSRTKMLVPFIF